MEKSVEQWSEAQQDLSIVHLEKMLEDTSVSTETTIPQNKQDIPFNYCPQCKVPYICKDQDYVCSICGRTAPYESEEDMDPLGAESSIMHINVGKRKGKYCICIRCLLRIACLVIDSGN